MTPTTSILLGAEAPRVLTVPMITAVLADRRKPPSHNTVFKWIREQTANGALRPVTRGLYINQLATPRPAAADAAGYVRSGAVLSLQSVLGEAGVTNNYSDIITCVVPQSLDHIPSVRPVKANRIEFRFHALPQRLLDERAGTLEDRLDSDAKYPRATPEKALLDWIHLGQSPRTRIALPPLDTDLKLLDISRLKRLAKHMNLAPALTAYLARKRKHDRGADEDATGTGTVKRPR